MLETPVAFFIFNRPATTARVFDAIRAAQPKRLLVISDGARPDRADEVALVAAARSVVEQVDWPCEVETSFSEVNLGCRKRMSSGLDWAFSRAEELIILEDDCLPSQSFFPFCESLLRHHRHDARVMMISGDNFQPARTSSESYYYSRWPHIWGWAGWQHKWECFDSDVSTWPAVKSSGNLRAAFASDLEYEYWSGILDRQYEGAIDTWDFPWAYSMWSNHGLAILPALNLVTNLGFGATATHTTDAQSPLANRPAADFSPAELAQLIHPQSMVPNYQADQFTWETILAPAELRTQFPPSKPRSCVSQSPPPAKWYRRRLWRAARPT